MSESMKTLMPEVLDFILLVIHWSGIKRGIEIGADFGRTPRVPERDYSDMRWSYVVSNGVTDLNIGFIYGEETTLRLLGRGQKLVADFVEEPRNLYKIPPEMIIRSKDYDFSLFDKVIQKMLPRINASKSLSIRPCENVSCVSFYGWEYPQGYESLSPWIPYAWYRGDRWVCEKCKVAYTLPAETPIPNTNEPEKIKAERAKLTGKLRFEIFERDGYACRACGRNPREHGIVLHIDHIIPLAQGGKTEKDNLQVLCADCNLAKSDNVSHQMALW